ncbi:MAG: FAD-binding oxidoreductase [Chloroflexi bacterium HGW-Chloroflexi-9]|nr:MAG: FAD-binding oxidoreductase [Chloroflexi bacterium HGW-Chloroflexi-9]
METAPLRPVLAGRTPPPQDSVHRALDLLRGPASVLETLAEDLALGLEGGRADVLTERASRLLYATDASIYEMEPVAIVFPRSASDVQHATRIARARGIPLLPRGAGTSLAGQGVNHAIVLDFSRHLNRVLEVDPVTRTARVQPGANLDSISRAARPHGLHYAVDPSTRNRATIGGGIGNNSCGAHSVRHGKTLDQVVSLEVVLSDASTARFEPLSGAALDERLGAPTLEGDLYRAVRRIAGEYHEEIEARMPRIPRRVSGYNLDAFADPGVMDLSRLIVGSEGTLATVVEATVRLAPIPAAKGVVALHYASVAAACHATPLALTHDPAAVELVDRTIIERCRANPGYASLAAFVQGDPGALLLVECEGETADEVRARLDVVAASLTASSGAYAAVPITEAGAQLRLWRMREAGLGLLMSVRGDAKPIAFVEDAAVPPERLGEFVERFDALVHRHGTEVAHYGHASEGCLHMRPLVNIKQDTGLETIKAIASEVADLVVEFGGSLSGEHGDGILRGVFTQRMFGARLTEAFREVKRAFDPEGVLNPGKIVDTPAFDDHLRLGPWTRNQHVETHFSWHAEGGLARAAEQCNGQGACLKDAGAMCPSYMVTRDEEHSTRGRANLLRQAMNGALPVNALTDDRLAEALDLCVECKACKAECPSGVDMAKLKYEVMTLRHEAHGLPLRDRLFGRIGPLTRLASALGPGVAVLNLLAALRPVREVMHATLGIHRERPLPRLATQTFRRWFSTQPQMEPASRGDAVLFVDTFTDAMHPETGRAAVAVLNALGYAVTVVPRLGCCGRPLISKGQLGTAATWARRNIDRLAPYAARGVPIVGIEPSCLLTLRDEYVDLVPGARTTAVAEQAVLIGELVSRLAAEDASVAARFARLDRTTLLHGHCHEKAANGMEPALAALGLVEGLSVSLVDSACCGMAGSFGYEAEHYDVSRAMAERSLLPAVHAASAATDILVTGISCREQVEHLSGRRPRHFVELLAEALRP